MEQPYILAIEDIIGDNDILNETKENTIEYWRPDLPPITVIFADIGLALGKNMDRISIQDVKDIIKRAEKWRKIGDDSIETAVSTGFIETFASECHKLNKWDDLKNMISPQFRLDGDLWVYGELR